MNDANPIDLLFAGRDFAAETIKEIEVFERSEGSYGYVFYALQRA